MIKLIFAGLALFSFTILVLSGWIIPELPPNEHTDWLVRGFGWFIVFEILEERDRR